MKPKLRLLLAALLCLCACLLFSPTAFAEGGGEPCDVILTESWADFAAAASELVKEGWDNVQAASVGSVYETARLIVKMEGELPDLSRFAPKTILRDPENHYLIQFADAQTAEDCARFLETVENVIYVEPDQIISLDSIQLAEPDTLPENGESGEISSLEDTLDETLPEAKSWGVAAIHADEYAADLAARGKTSRVVVAVVDSGAELSHPMLSGRLTEGYDFVDNDNTPQDGSSHGTHVSGIVVDSTPGLNVYVMPVRVLNDEGKGADSTVALGVRYAAENDVNVINMSLGGPHSSYKEEAIDIALQKGITVVVASGNDGIDNSNYCPAHIPACITVAAADQSMNRASFSNYGSAVDIAAPGVGIVSAVPGGGYESKDGTSMAAPYVSAASAMLLCDEPGANPASLLCGAATDRGTAGWDSYYGAGFLNLESFVKSGTRHYTISYNANGGSAAPASQRKAQGETLTLSTSRPIRLDESGSLTVTLEANGGSVTPTVLTPSASFRFSFKNWNTEANGGGRDYAPGGSYTRDENAVLYAQWNRTVSSADPAVLPIPTRADSSAGQYTVTLDANGGTVATKSLSAELITRYTFRNWNTAQDGSGTSYNAGSESFSDDAVLYAQWSENTAVTPVTLPTPTRENYTFLGWATDAAAAGGVTGSYTPDGDVTLYAIWERTVSASGTTGNLSWRLYADGELVIAGSGPMPDYSYNTFPWYEQRSLVKTVSIQPGVTSIGSHAFYYCSSMTSVTIPASVTSIGSSAFDGCSGLTSVTIPDGVTAIDRFAFSRCSGLTSVKIPDSVTAIGSYAFYYCKGLTNITIPAAVTSIGAGAFAGCEKLIEIAVAEGNSSYCVIDGSLYSKDQKTIFCCPAGKSGSFAIPDGVTSIGDSAFSDCSKLTSVTIPDGVTSIGSSAFSGCRKLTSVTIPDGVTSISDETFYICDGLTSVTIPSSVTSIGDYAFYDCSGLSSVTIPSSVTSIGRYAFEDCSGLSSVTIPSSVTSIGDYAFDDCTGLTAVHISDLSAWCRIKFDSVSSNPLSMSANLILNGKMLTDLVIPDDVISIGSVAFYNCSWLTSVTIPDSVTSIGVGVFYNCSGLTSVTIPNSVTSIGSHAFSGCSGLTTVILTGRMPQIRDTAFESVTANVRYPAETETYTEASMGNYGGTLTWVPDASLVYTVTYRGNGGIPEKETETVPKGLALSLPSATRKNYSLLGWSTDAAADSGVTGSYTPDGDVTLYAIWGKSVSASGTTGGLTWRLYVDGELVIAGNGPMPDYSYRTSPWYSKLSYVKTVNIQPGVTAIGEWAFDDCSYLTSVTIPDSVASIGSRAFDGCSGLTSVTIPDSVTAIGNYAFSSCSGLTSITIPDSVTAIGYGAFSSCSGLKSVTIPVSVTSIGDYAFRECSKLTNVTIPDSVTSIGRYAFEDCSGLTSVTIPDSVTSIGDGAFAGCGKLVEITVTEGNSSFCVVDGCLYSKDQKTILCCPAWKSGSFAIPDGVTSIGGAAFKDCTGLTSVTIPDSVTSIGGYAFDGCSGLTSVTIPDGVTSIGNGAFYYCSGLTSVAIPDGVTAIGEWAFYKCSGLASVTIPNGVTSIGDFAFARCTGLTSVTIPDSVTSIGESAFRGCSGLESVTIPDSVTSIGEEAFRDCSGLTSVTFPASVTSIGDYAFYNCSGLTGVTIPDSVTAIGDFAFAYCNGLTSVTLIGNKPSIGNYTFKDVSAVVYYPAENPTYTRLGNYGGTLTWTRSYDYVAVLSYDANGGTLTNTREAVAKGRPATLPVPTREGYLFRGWAENAEAQTVLCRPGGTLTPAGDMTLYALWTEVPQPDGVLPAGLKALEDEALAGTAFTCVKLPEGMTAIGSRAFDGCVGLTAVYIPASVTSIAADAFVGAPAGVAIIGEIGSEAARFAEEADLAFLVG